MKNDSPDFLFLSFSLSTCSSQYHYSLTQNRKSLLFYCMHKHEICPRYTIQFQQHNVRPRIFSISKLQAPRERNDLAPSGLISYAGNRGIAHGGMLHMVQHVFHGSFSVILWVEKKETERGSSHNAPSVSLNNCLPQFFHYSFLYTVISLQLRVQEVKYTLYLVSDEERGGKK